VRFVPGPIYNHVWMVYTDAKPTLTQGAGRSGQSDNACSVLRRPLVAQDAQVLHPVRLRRALDRRKRPKAKPSDADGGVLLIGDFPGSGTFTKAIAGSVRSSWLSAAPIAVGIALASLPTRARARLRLAFLFFLPLLLVRGHVPTCLRIEDRVRPGRRSDCTVISGCRCPEHRSAARRSLPPAKRRAMNLFP